MDFSRIYFQRNRRMNESVHIEKAEQERISEKKITIF